MKNLFSTIVAVLRVLFQIVLIGLAIGLLDFMANPLAFIH